MSKNAGSGENSDSGEISPRLLRMIRANKLTQLEGPRNVGEFGENGEFGKSGDFVNVGEKIISEYI